MESRYIENLEILLRKACHIGWDSDTTWEKTNRKFEEWFESEETQLVLKNSIASQEDEEKKTTSKAPGWEGKEIPSFNRFAINALTIIKEQAETLDSPTVEHLRSHLLGSTKRALEFMGKHYFEGQLDEKELEEDRIWIKQVIEIEDIHNTILKLTYTVKNLQDRIERLESS